MHWLRLHHRQIILGINNVCIIMYYYVLLCIITLSNRKINYSKTDNTVWQYDPSQTDNTGHTYLFICCIMKLCVIEHGSDVWSKRKSEPKPSVMLGSWAHMSSTVISWNFPLKFLLMHFQWDLGKRNSTLIAGTTYGSKGPGWILSRIVSLFCQLQSLKTPILKEAQTKIRICSSLFCL